MIELLIVFLVTGVLGFILVMVNKIIGPKKSNPIKQTPFECGSPYLQKGIPPVPIKFYLVAFLFLLFDVEVVFFFPWALIFKEIGSLALISMSVYILILIVGFAYAWGKGAFAWEK
ncbi:MAG: NADH-quinone oxidoreductase subunit A [Candidatus Aminicenantes bacterium]|nr:NADH-quinone oxidoreductase subunit A [Candidatus Aminicenantes bacterium]